MLFLPCIGELNTDARSARGHLKRDRHQAVVIGIADSTAQHHIRRARLSLLSCWLTGEGNPGNGGDERCSKFLDHNFSNHGKHVEAVREVETGLCASGTCAAVRP